MVLPPFPLSVNVVMSHVDLSRNKPNIDHGGEGGYPHWIIYAKSYKIKSRFVIWKQSRNMKNEPKMVSGVLFRALHWPLAVSWWSTPELYRYRLLAPRQRTCSYCSSRKVQLQKISRQGSWAHTSKRGLNARFFSPKMIPGVLYRDRFQPHSVPKWSTPGLHPWRH